MTLTEIQALIGLTEKDSAGLTRLVADNEFGYIPSLCTSGGVPIYWRGLRHRYESRFTRQWFQTAAGDVVWVST